MRLHSAAGSARFGRWRRKPGCASPTNQAPRASIGCPEIIGSGVALLDYDGDGDLDVYLRSGIAGRPHLQQVVPQRIGRRTGGCRFTDVTETAGRRARGWGMGAAVGDYDNDGDPDLYVTSFGSNMLYRNEGHGTFTDVTSEAGVDDPRWSASAAFVDYDADGDLDLFVTAYVDFSEKGNKPCYDPAGQRDYCLPAEFRPLPARLFRNEGGGRFSDVTDPSGIGSAAGAGLGVVAADVERGRVPRSLRGQRWNDEPPLDEQRQGQIHRSTDLMSGTAYDAAGRAEAGMGVAAADFDARRR